MTTDEFMAHYCDRELRQYIVDQAKRHSRRTALQEEYVQEAWLAISCAPGSFGCEALKRVAYKAIYSEYWQSHKETLISRAYDEHREAAAHKTPEEPTDNDPYFMEKVQSKDWRL